MTPDTLKSLRVAVIGAGYAGATAALPADDPLSAALGAALAGN